jgi:hypothetical protein
MKLLRLILIAFFVFFQVTSNASLPVNEQSGEISKQSAATVGSQMNQLLESMGLGADSSYQSSAGRFDEFTQVVNLSCGIPPIPPVGCKVGACVCDRNGRNCQWTFICN